MSAPATASITQIFENGRHIVTLSGALTMANVAFLFKSLIHPSKDKILMIDMRDVTEADSSGLALLTTIMRRAKENGAQVQLLPLPTMLASIIEIYGLQDILAAYQA